MTDYPDPARVVADADVLAADLLVGGASRESLDLVRNHESLTLVLSDAIIDDAQRVIAAVADQELATDWASRVRDDAALVSPTLAGHPALAAAAAGNAGSVLSFDERLQSAAAGVTIRTHVATSVKSPEAFVSIVDPTSLAEGNARD